MESYPEEGRIGQAFRTHRLEDLLFLAGLTRALQQEAAKGQSQLGANWRTVKDWTPEIRYLPVGTNAQVTAFRLLKALDHPRDGVLTWIARRW